MKLNILNRLNPTYETLGLIYLVKNHDIFLEESIKELNSNGINGELFIKNNLKILEKYINEFKKHMIIEENELFMYKEEDDKDLFFLIAITLVNYDGDINSFSQISEEEARKLILESYYEMMECSKLDNIRSIGDILKFIEKQDISDKNKWKLMKILNNPKETIESILKIIDNNKIAYEKAHTSVEKQLNKLIEKLEKYITSGECEAIESLVNIEESTDVIPSLVFGMGIAEIKGKIFAGVLVETILKEQLKAIGDKGKLVLKLKALSDNSKLETISLLKKGPMYSLEIAESLNLTSATVSYHMNTLLEIGFVSVEKKQGKVYYHLNKVAMQKFIDDLNNTLL